MLIEIRLSRERWYKMIDSMMLFLTSFFVITSLFFALLLFKGEGLKKEKKQSLAKLEPLLKEESALLERTSPAFALPEIEKSLFFLGKDKRPGVGEGLWLGIAGEKEALYHTGDKVFLSCFDEEKIDFSETPTPFWIEIGSVSNGSVQATFTSSYLDGEGGTLFKETKEVDLVEKRLSDRQKSDPLCKAIVSLKKVTCYGVDRFLETYGGAIFQDLKSKVRLDFEGGSSLHFVKGDEKFVWKEGKWVEAQEENLPLLWVEKVTKDSAKLLLFDEKGYLQETLDIPLEKASYALTKPGELFTGLRMRSKQSVLCKLSQHNMILRKGDFLLHGKNGWRNLQTADEIKKYLCYHLSGELFVFDGIVGTKTGYLFTGHLFDEKRTSVQKIELPLADKKILKKIGKKNETIASLPSKPGVVKSLSKQPLEEEENIE